jgi:predicted transcriptional regulator
VNERIMAVAGQAVAKLGKATSLGVAEATGIPVSTIRKCLLALYRVGKLGRRKRATNTGGPEFVYWVSGQLDDIPSPLQSTKDRTLEAVKGAGGEIDSQGVADIVGYSVSTVQVYLKQLLDEGGVTRRPKRSSTGRSSSGKGFLYEYADEAQAVVSEESQADAWFLAEGMGEAIERNRPHWRMGELFTKEERERFRDDAIHRRSTLGPRQYR